VVDELDRQIIEILERDGRLAFTKISDELDVSVDAVARRYEKLVRGNIIKVSIQINPLKLGYQAILHVDVAFKNQSETPRVVDQLSKITGVTYLVTISGSYDLSLAALVKDCNDIMRIDEEITKIPNFKRMEATLRPAPSVWPGRRQYISTF
jgi:Lrp/AsnC family transcriptional regulator for asnA, asnC and gidA